MYKPHAMLSCKLLVRLKFQKYEAVSLLFLTSFAFSMSTILLLIFSQFVWADFKFKLKNRLSQNMYKICRIIFPTFEIAFYHTSRFTSKENGFLTKPTRGPISAIVVSHSGHIS